MGMACIGCMGSETCPSGACVPAGWMAQSSGTTNNLDAVWGSGPGDVYVVGDSTVLHSTGAGTWTAQALPGPVVSAGNIGLRSVWGSSMSDVYAVGDGAVVVHSTGAGTWTLQNGPVTGGFFGVWGSSATDVYATSGGSNGAFAYSTGNGTWIGSSPGSIGGLALTAIWGSGAGDIYATGGSNSLGGDGILHSTGGGTSATWTMELNLGFTTTSQVLGLWGSGSGDVYAVGEGGTIYHSTGNGTWTSQTSGTSQDLSAVWGSGSGDVYAVGASGTVLHSTGTGTWTALASNTTQNLVGVWGSGSTDVYAVGAQGTILHLQQ
jgi:hypothetical protein